MKIDAVYGCVSSSNVFSRDKVSRYSFLSYYFLFSAFFPIRGGDTLVTGVV